MVNAPVWAADFNRFHFHFVRCTTAAHKLKRRITGLIRLKDNLWTVSEVRRTGLQLSLLH